MKKNFLGLIWSNFLKIKGTSGIVITFGLAVVLWLFPSNKNISLSLAIPIGLLLLIFIITLGNAAYESFNKSKHFLPKVLYGKKSRTSIQGEQVLCLLEPSELFFHDSLVSFYYITDNNFEQFIGIGKVINIQDDGKIQVVMFYSLDGQEEITNKLADNNSTILSKTKVKPNIPVGYLNAALKGG